ncbi:MAG: septum site-determining protein MinC [Thermoanaerobacteraceae bacterium]|uniref:septum site-determining protein MinC n=1 Tax=Thermanaeromonas sp. C210 TaxID=2731925 RepID=UPI00155C7045|nr:septum site-determining protein MinC [Thermanaeromonas sp. C210]MBE3580051.1 septum site-determining protein MinC [Thermoanaerobacteraceae bacterium]GFN22601.1 septum site-determining protein MinC [Thermanaeromonas sp. C210]
MPSGGTLALGKSRCGPGHTLLVRRTVRSGQRIDYPGNMVIMGDVNPGGEVVAGGHVIVMGALKGIVHAGAEGDEGAVVIAFDLRPTQLRIAGYIARPPDVEDKPTRQPEIARVQDGTVIIERYQPGGERRFLNSGNTTKEEEQDG